MIETLAYIVASLEKATQHSQRIALRQLEERLSPYFLMAGACSVSNYQIHSPIAILSMLISSSEHSSGTCGCRKSSVLPVTVAVVKVLRK